MPEAQAMPHQVVINERKQLTVSGVSDVDSFDDNTIIARTSLGELTVKGSQLQICRLNIADGDLTVEGRVDLLEYAVEEPHVKGRRFSRLFR